MKIVNLKDNTTVEKIRKDSFRAQIPLNKKLLKLIESGGKDYLFLENPAEQNIYLYLCEYVKNLSEWYFKKSFKDLKILDWGCGKGQVTFLLREMNANIISSDIESESNDSAFGQDATPIIAKTNIRVVPLRHEYFLPFGDQEFDVVLSFGVLEHTPNNLESLKEINRILKPEALFFCFNLPYFLSWTQRLAYIRGNFYHNKLYRKTEVRNLLNKSNFNLIDIWHRQLLPKNTVRYHKYRFFEAIDQFLVSHTFLKYFATSIEFVAHKKR